MDQTTVIDYREIPGAPGRYFTCPRIPGDPTLSSTACADQWKIARSAKTEETRDRLHACRNCPIGAKHAGAVDFIPKTTTELSRVCVRCEQPGRRLIRDCLCVSCYNRELEVIKGANAKGTKPVRCQAVFNLSAVVKDGKRKGRVQSFIATGMLEVVLSAAKRAKDHAFIGFRGKVRPAAEQLRLF